MFNCRLIEGFTNPKPEYYPNPKYSVRACVPCAEGCKTCRDKAPDSCLECFDQNDLLLDSKCTNQCPEGYTQSKNKKNQLICVRCPKNCKFCKDPLQCNVCLPTHTLYQSKCHKHCPEGTQPKQSNSIHRECEAINCGPLCTECLDKTHCKACKKKEGNRLVVPIQNGCYLCSKPNGLIEKDQNCYEVCGDRILYRLDTDKNHTQFCDDGNIINGDGCSSDCKIERGYSCSRNVGYLTRNDFRSGPDKCDLIPTASMTRAKTPENKFIFGLSFSENVDASQFDLENHFHFKIEEEAQVEESEDVIKQPPPSSSSEVAEGEVEKVKVNKTTMMVFSAKKISSKLFELTLLNIDSFERDFFGMIRLYRNSDPDSERFNVRTIGKQIPVEVEGLGTEFVVNYENFKDEANFSEIILNVESYSKDIKFQLIMLAISITPMLFSLTVNLSQRLMYFQLLNIKYPKLIKRAFEVLSTAWSFNPYIEQYGAKDDGKVSWMDKVIGLKPGDENPPAQFKALKISAIYFKSVLPSLLVVASYYLLSLTLVYAKKCYDKWRVEYWKKELKKTNFKRIKVDGFLTKYFGGILELLSSIIIWGGIIKINILTIQNLTIGVFLNLSLFKLDDVAFRVSYVLSLATLGAITLNIILYIYITEGYMKKYTKEVLPKKRDKDEGSEIRISKIERPGRGQEQSINGLDKELERGLDESSGSWFGSDNDYSLSSSSNRGERERGKSFKGRRNRFDRLDMIPREKGEYRQNEQRLRKESLRGNWRLREPHLDRNKKKRKNSGVFNFSLSDSEKDEEFDFDFKNSPFNEGDFRKDGENPFSEKNDKRDENIQEMEPKSQKFVNQGVPRLRKRSRLEEFMMRKRAFPRGPTYRRETRRPFFNFMTGRTQFTDRFDRGKIFGSRDSKHQDLNRNQEGRGTRRVENGVLVLGRRSVYKSTPENNDLTTLDKLKDNSTNKETQEKNTDSGSLEYSKSLEIMSGTRRDYFFTRNFKTLFFMVRPLILSFSVSFCYYQPYIPLTMLSIFHVTELISGLLLKVYTERVYNIGLALEGGLFLLFSLLSFYIYIAEGRGDAGSVSYSQNGVIGYCMLAIIITGILVSIGLRLGGRGKL